MRWIASFLVTFEVSSGLYWEAPIERLIGRNFTSKRRKIFHLEISKIVNTKVFLRPTTTKTVLGQSLLLMTHPSGYSNWISPQLTGQVPAH